MIHIDAVKNFLNVDVSDEEMAERRSRWKAPPLKASQGTLLKYARLVSDASHGCGERLGVVWMHLTICSDRWTDGMIICIACTFLHPCRSFARLS